MKRSLNRRRFLAGAALGATGPWFLGNSTSAWSAQANEKVNLAVVGLGGRGTYHFNTFSRTGQNLVAICDADRSRMAEPGKRMPKVPQFQDFRKMLDELDGKLDGLIVATPEHTHAVISATAMKRGKGVFCEKPIAHDVAEARALRRIARQQKVATQQGNQGMATDSFRRTLELIEDGAIGEVREAHVWYVFGGSGPMKRPQGSQPVPDYVNWEVWLGPAAFRPFHSSYLRGWGGWRDFSTGCLGGGGSHSINVAFKGLKLRGLWEKGEGEKKIRVETEISERCPESFPRWQIVHYHIPKRGSLPPATIHWYNAQEAELVRLGIWQKLEKIAGRSLEWTDNSWTPRSGTLLVGSKGVVHTNAHNSVCALLPEKDFPNSKGPLQRLPHSPGHEREWHEAIRGAGPAPLSNFDHSGPAMELLLLGNIASLVGETLEFDPVAGRIVNHEEADRAIRPPHREGWSV